jgi:hypothetical protein
LRSAAIAAAAWGVATYWPAVLLVRLPVIAAFIIAAFAVTGEFEIPAVYRLRIASAARAAIPMAVFLLAAIVLQWRDGAFHAEFDGHPDEAGHFITSLMIRDYAATRIGSNPLAFARDYYLHYPRVALGHWPPVFHTALAAWMLLFTAGRVPVMIFMAMLSAGVAFLIYRFLDPRMGRASALGFGLLWLCVPLARYLTSTLMTEVLLALACFGAALVYARYLRTGAWQDAAWFGVIALAAVLIKANGWMLGLVPPIAILVMRQIHWIRQAGFWLPALIVVPPGAAWYALTLQPAQHGWVGTTSVKYMAHYVLQYNCSATLETVGWGVLLAALAGLAVRVGPALRGRKVEPEWSCLAAVWIAWMIFHSFVAPVQEHRHLLISLPPMIVFAAAGLRWAAGRLGLPAIAAAAAAFVLLAAGAPPASAKPAQGYTQLADLLCAQTQFELSAFLIQTDQPGGEGPFIAEIAMRDHRPQHYVIRRTKWLPENADLLHELERLPVSVVVIESHRDSNSPLAASIAAAPERVQQLWSTDSIRAYRLLRSAPGPPGKFRLDLRRSSAGIIEN